MATLSLQNFTSLVSTGTAAVQGACAQIVDLTIGSPIRAVLDANATVALWIQWLILQVLSLTRASSSSGPDLDTWMADFSFTRLAATQATGTVTMLRYTASAIAAIAPGVQVKTLDGTQTFVVLPDLNNVTGNWSLALSAYSVPAGTASCNVLVQAVNAGTQGNVAAGAIGLLASAVPGFDTCTNALPFVNALDAESDAALRARFALYINSRSLATGGALLSAVYGVQQGLTAYLLAGAPFTGATTIYVDDGSGAVPASVLAGVAAAVQPVHAEGTTVAVQQAPVQPAAININFTSAPGYVHGVQAAAIAAAVSSLVGSLPVGATLSYAQFAAAVFGATAGIVTVQALTINGLAADLVPALPYQVVRISSLTVE